MKLKFLLFALLAAGAQPSLAAEPASGLGETAIEPAAAVGARGSRLPLPEGEHVVSQHETKIVPGPGVLDAGIAQTHDQAVI